ncbi:hypothetical protein J3F84DRAFT_203936 [Trichoderma pleuroticola]
MYSCGAPFTRPIPACLVLPCPPLSACFCRLCGRKSPKNPLAAVPAVHIDHSLSFPSTFFLYPLAGSRKKTHTKAQDENSPIRVAAPLQKSLMMGIGHETLAVLRSGLSCPWLQADRVKDEDGHGASAVGHGQLPASNGLLPNAVDAMAISTVHQSRRAHVAQPASPHVIRPGHREVRPGCVTTPALRKSSHKKDRLFHRRLVYLSSRELEGARRNISLWSRPVRGFV